MECLNRKNISIYYFLLIFILLIMLIFCFLLSLFLSSQKSDEEIFSKSVYSVVEVKAHSEDTGESFGSGVFVKSDGTLVTNSHVVTYRQMGEPRVFDNIEIRFSFENDYRSVTLIKYEEDLDIAILKLDDLNCNFEAIEFADSKECRTGNLVYAVGNLNNVGISMTKGIVSNPSINVEYDEKIRNVIQCDLVIAEGNSGGALLDRNGKLLGITTFRLRDSSQNVIYGICYCVPAAAVVEYINNK